MSLLGKVLRIDINKMGNRRGYAIPPDNPFIRKRQTFRPEIYAYGVRNIWRCGKESGESYIISFVFVQQRLIIKYKLGYMLNFQNWKNFSILYVDFGEREKTFDKCFFVYILSHKIKIFELVNAIDYLNYICNENYINQLGSEKLLRCEPRLRVEGRTVTYNGLLL